jgi:glutathione peroxidase
LLTISGFTPQYNGLEELYETYHGQGLEVVGFPTNEFGGQEPAADEAIAEFCQVSRNFIV